MKRTARDKRDLPHPRPVERIELDEEHTSRRLILSVLLLILGAGLLVYSFVQFLSPQTEWTEIRAGTGEGITCGNDFSFLYRLGSAGGSAAAENKAVSLLYTQACRRAYQIFLSEEEFEGMGNLCTVNRHPNEPVEVDEGLYRAFALMEAQGSRAMYLGPVYDRYEAVFYCQEDYELADYDPWSGEAVREEYRTVAEYAGDPQSVALELLGENRVCLRVSQDYMAYARQESITAFIGFGWMKNAFIADYLAEKLTGAGYTTGVISSYDGFVRNMDVSGTGYSLNLFDRQGNVVYPAAVMQYQGPMSLVSMRNYPLNELDGQRFYELENGEIRTAYIDTRDGLNKTAANNLVCYSREMGCAQLVLEAAPVYVADVFREEAVEGLKERGIHSIYCKEGVICCTDPQLRLTNFYDQDGVRYRQNT